MKRIIKSLITLGAMIAASCVNADAKADLNPYLGADYYQAWMKAKEGYRRVLPEDFTGATLYVATKFHENFGLELGYDWSARKKKDFMLVAGSRLFGTPLTNTVTGSTKVNRVGGHLDLVGSLPIAERLDLVGSMGVGWVQAKIAIDSVSPLNFPGASAISSLSGKGRCVFRMGVGGTYMVTAMMGLRAKLGWESTSNLRVDGNPNFTMLGVPNRPYKGTTSLSLGALVKF